MNGQGEVRRVDDDAVTRRHGEPGMPASEGSPSDPTEPLAASPPRRVAVSEVLAWLDARATAPPPELRERMAAALEDVTSETVPGALAEAALSCLQATMTSGGERASALDLLAADALLTYALEAAAEMGAQALRDVVDAYGPSRLGEVIPPRVEP